MNKNNLQKSTYYKAIKFYVIFWKYQAILSKKNYKLDH